MTKLLRKITQCTLLFIIIIIKPKTKFSVSFLSELKSRKYFVCQKI